MREKLKLQPDQTLRKIGSTTDGFMGETDVSEFEIVNERGEVMGFVTYKEHMTVKGFRQTYSLVQKDLNQRIIVDQRWQ